MVEEVFIVQKILSNGGYCIWRFSDVVASKKEPEKSK